MYLALNSNGTTSNFNTHLKRKHSKVATLKRTSFTSSVHGKEKLNQQVCDIVLCCSVVCIAYFFFFNLQICFALAANDLPFSIMDSPSFRQVFLREQDALVREYCHVSDGAKATLK